MSICEPARPATSVAPARGTHAPAPASGAAHLTEQQVGAPLGTRPSRSNSGQEGFTLAALIVILTIIAVIIAYTVPDQWSLIMKRERDRQTIFLMKQYARAILAWETKHRGLPVSLEQLQEARDPRMIRGGGKWACPLTGKEDDWILVPPGAITQDGQAVPTNVQNNPAFGGGNRPGGKKDNADKIGIGNPDTGGNQATAASPFGVTGKLNPEASPADYVGPFVAIRPNATGKSYIALKGAEDYGEWVYSLQDLKNEILMRQTALQAR
jgi:type II secretory pathway pseudopilin PulG